MAQAAPMLVSNLHVAPDEEIEEVAVLPDGFQI